MNYESRYRDGRLSEVKVIPSSNNPYLERIPAALTGDGKAHGALRLLVIFLACALIAVAAGVSGMLIYYGYKDVSLREGGFPSSQASDGKLPLAGLGSNAGGAAVLTKLDGKLTATDIYNLACNSCVGITTSITTTNAFGQTTGSAISGSGFIISADGLILTNYHVVQTADESGLEILVMLFDGSEYAAEIVGRDSENDVALLRIDAEKLQPVRTGDFGSVKVGETIYAIGNPLGELTYSMTSGIVSALDRTIAVEANMPINMFQIDAAINSGNSGGPVFNARGEVIGIASAKYSSAGVEGLGFAIPIDDALAIAGDLLKYGYVKGRPLFGITVYTVMKGYDAEVDGACVASVDPGGCSDKAGLRIGDIVTAIDGTEVASSSDLIAAKKERKAGDTVVLTVYRNGEYMTLSVTLDEAGPPASAPAQEETTGQNESYSEYGSGGGR